MKTCSIEGCGAPHKSKGYCIKHYCSLLRLGDPLAAKTKRQNGTGSVGADGYLYRRDDAGRMGEHVRVAEAAMGRELPPGAVVHHIDHNRRNNANANLVICPDRGYHALIHRRERALDACGNANWHKCSYCKTYDDPANMSARPGRGPLPLFRHLACVNEYNKALIASKKENQSSMQT